MDVRYSGLIAMTVNEGDSLRWVKWTNGTQEIVMASANGQSILFHESDVRVMGRQAAGVMGMRLSGNDEIAGMDVVETEHTHVLVVTENGFGKRTPLEAVSATGSVRQRSSDAQAQSAYRASCRAALHHRG